MRTLGPGRSREAQANKGSDTGRDGGKLSSFRCPTWSRQYVSRGEKGEKDILVVDSL